MSSFQQDHFYHIYNRGNNKQSIFFTRANYSFFLDKIRKELSPVCDIICYCLMPNHYHLMIYFSPQHVNFRQRIKMENLERKIGTLQSSYTRAINNQEGRVGSLFQAKFKVVEIVDITQAIICFNYFHQNPVKAGFVTEPGLWSYSSFNEYYCRVDGICMRQVAYKRLCIPSGNEFQTWLQSSDHASRSDD